MKTKSTMSMNDRGIIKPSGLGVKLKGRTKILAMNPDVNKDACIANCKITLVDGGFILQRLNKRQILFFENSTIKDGVIRSTRSGKAGVFSDPEVADAWYEKNKYK